MVINEGETVKFENTAKIAHTMISGTFYNRTGHFDSGLVAPGGSWEWTALEGTYPYFCTLHTGMNGKLVVLPTNTNLPPIGMIFYDLFERILILDDYVRTVAKETFEVRSAIPDVSTLETDVRILKQQLASLEEFTNVPPRVPAPVNTLFALLFPNTPPSEPPRPPFSAILRWAAPADLGSPITGYEVRSSTSPNGPWKAERPHGPDLTNLYYLTRADLEPNTTYYFQVAARNNVGLGPWSESKSITTPTVESQDTGVQGTVYRDTNNNNRLDSGENGIPGIDIIAVNLADHSDVETVATDSVGYYSFDLSAGGYLIQAIHGGPNSYAYITIPNNTMLTQNLAY